MTGTGGFTIALSIDELDIASVKLGQNATVTLDALTGEFTGTVTNISYSGSGSYVTSYTATITTEPMEGAYPGMSASAEIITETSGETLIVPVSAVQYEGDSAFVYLAGDGVQAGENRAEGQIDLDSLTKLTVTTGMSDGSYIVVTAEGLAAGDVIWSPERTSTATYSADDTTTTSTFGVGDHFNEDLLQAMAESGDGRYVYLEKAGQYAKTKGWTELSSALLDGVTVLRAMIQAATVMPASAHVH